jgi:hypothetical protein
MTQFTININTHGGAQSQDAPPDLTSELPRVMIAPLIGNMCGRCVPWIDSSRTSEAHVQRLGKA